MLDGSPQGRTAWMKTPYTGTDNEYGIGTLSDKKVTEIFHTAVNKSRQLLAHCNGDAACEQFIRCAESIHDEKSVASIRPVIIHGQLLGINQLARIKKLGIIPSFFVAHCYHFGDTHIKNFGIERASEICPAASALQNGIVFTFHQDTPVIEPDMLETLWCAVNRRTREGTVLGSAEAIPIEEALRAVTSNAAYQYFEETYKGTLAPGFREDLVILDQNPLTVPREQLNTIKVLATIKDGQIIYNCGVL